MLCSKNRTLLDCLNNRQVLFSGKSRTPKFGRFTVQILSHCIETNLKLDVPILHPYRTRSNFCSLFQSKGPIVLKEHTTRNLLLCFLWVLKNVEKSVLKQWWTELPHNRLLTLLEVLRITLSCFQYKVRTRNSVTHL